MAKLLRRLAIGAAVAGAAGYLAGVLSAPAKGSKTRKQLKKSASSEINDVESQLKDLQGELSDLVARAKGHSGKLSGRAEKQFGGALDNAHSAKNKLRDVISSIHNGEASNKDLSKALEDARRSLDHLKNFIRK